MVPAKDNSMQSQSISLPILYTAHRRHTIHKRWLPICQGGWGSASPTGLFFPRTRKF